MGQFERKVSFVANPLDAMGIPGGREGSVDGVSTYLLDNKSLICASRRITVERHFPSHSPR